MTMDSSKKFLPFIIFVLAIGKIHACTYNDNVYNRNITTELVKSTDIDYKILHELAILDQIHYYEPVLSSHSSRIAKNLDGLYDFCLDSDGIGFAQDWFNRSLTDSCPEDRFYQMPVPSAFNDITSDHRVRNHMGWVWYQREVIIRTSAASVTNGKSKYDWLIHFEASNYMSLVWGYRLDGQGCTELLTSHVGGHLPFVANLTKLLNCNPANKPSSSLRILLTVAVSNQLNADTIPSGSMVNLTRVVGKPSQRFKPDFDFFHFSGLIGSVNLLKLAKTHWKHVKQLVEDETSQDLQTRFEACLSTSSLKVKHSSHIEAHLMSSSHSYRSGSNCSINIDRDSNKTSCYILSIHSKCIDQNSKFATLNLIYAKGSSVVDSFELRVVPRHPRRMLNPQIGLFASTTSNQMATDAPILMRGFGMHHEEYFSGRTMSLPAIMKDLNLIKWTGANVLRTSHYPYSTAYLDACDELGISVIAECQAVGLKSFSNIKLALHKQLLREMMQRDHSHPSIIAWSVANEPQSQLPPAKAYFESLLSYARNELAEFTKSRPLTAAIAQAHQDDKIAHTLDFIMVNHYFGWYDHPGVIEAIRLPLMNSLVGWSTLHPGKGLLISEFGADTIAGFHSFSPDSDIFSEEYQRDLIMKHEEIFDELWCMNKKNNWTIPFLGSMVWNFADFSTDVSLLRVGGNKKGVFNRDRNPKMAAHTIRAAYLNKTTC